MPPATATHSLRNFAPLFPVATLIAHMSAVEKVAIPPSNHDLIAAIAPQISKKRGRPRIAKTNPLNVYLSASNAPGFSLARIPYIDHIVTGAVNLDMGGNTRPLSKKVILSMLLRLDEISTKAVQDYMHLTLRPCEDRQAQNIASCLRVVVNAATKLPLPELPAAETNYNIEPCGNLHCTICAASAHPWEVSLDSNEESMDDFAVELDYLN